jgi:hypothetical protein
LRSSWGWGWRGRWRWRSRDRPTERAVSVLAVHGAEPAFGYAMHMCVVFGRGVTLNLILTVILALLA